MGYVDCEPCRFEVHACSIQEWVDEYHLAVQVCACRISRGTADGLGKQVDGPQTTCGGYRMGGRVRRAAHKSRRVAVRGQSPAHEHCWSQQGTSSVLSCPTPLPIRRIDLRVFLDHVLMSILCTSAQRRKSMLPKHYSPAANKIAVSPALSDLSRGGQTLPSMGLGANGPSRFAAGGRSAAEGSRWAANSSCECLSVLAMCFGLVCGRGAMVVDC